MEYFFLMKGLRVFPVIFLWFSCAAPVYGVFGRVIEEILLTGIVISDGKNYKCIILWMKQRIVIVWISRLLKPIRKHWTLKGF